jgi:hypothetical protein
MLIGVSLGIISRFDIHMAPEVSDLWVFSEESALGYVVSEGSEYADI